MEEIRKDLVEIKVILATNTATLVEHTKRTELAEKRLERLEQWYLGFLVAIVLALIGNLLK